MRLARVGFVLIDLSIFLPQPPDMLLLISSNDLLALQLQHIPQPADPDAQKRCHQGHLKTFFHFIQVRPFHPQGMW